MEVIKKTITASYNDSVKIVTTFWVEKLKDVRKNPWYKCYGSHYLSENAVKIFEDELRNFLFERESCKYRESSTALYTAENFSDFFSITFAKMNTLYVFIPKYYMTVITNKEVIFFQKQPSNQASETERNNPNY